MRTRARTALGLFVTTLVVVLTAALGATTLSVPAASAATSPWVPTTGVTISNPMGTDAQRHAIQHKIVKMIDSTPKRGFIRMMSWNVEGSSYVDALLRAHRRGVSVRVLMDESNVSENPNWKRLVRGLRGSGNLARPAAKRSIAKVCRDTCRFKAGAMHYKVFLFSNMSGRSYWVVHGAANLTRAIVDRQWTDVVTLQQRGPYLFWLHRFLEAWQDQPVSRPYQVASFGGNQQLALPFIGRNAGTFPVLSYLNNTKCRGTTRGAGYNNRTVVRIGIASIRGDIGMDIARQLKWLYNRGCNVRLIYAVMGGDVYKFLRRPGGRGPVPMRHVVSDPNHDGLFDYYLHTKFVAISGYVGPRRDRRVVVMGSPNWSNLSMISDENMAILNGKGANTAYWKFTDRWFMRPPPDNRIAPATATNLRTTRGVTDPYALIRRDLEESE